MTIKTKEVFKLLIALGISALIFWWLYKDINVDEIKEYLQGFDYRWILLSIVLSFFSHFIRALRWGQLLSVSGKKSSFKVNYLSVMIGYLANTLIPRLGEVTRCGIVSRKDGIPATFAFGTVITERLIDLLILLLLTGIVIILEFSRLNDHLSGQFPTLIDLSTRYWWLITALTLLGLYLFWFLILSKKPSGNKLVTKIRELVKGAYKGVLSITKIKKPLLFWCYTIGIWVLYFLMLYVISFGSEDTRGLGPMAGLAVLVAGSFGMAAPSQSGIGSFHVFVSQLLLLYGIGINEGRIFAFILHTSQLVTVLLVGTISLIVINFVKGANDKSD